MIDNEKKKRLFKSLGVKVERCFHFSGEGFCEGKAIQAHSIQNRGVLDKLVEDGHVIMLEVVVSAKSGPQLVYRRVGRNKATTFTGLCSRHDNDLFEPIDNEATLCANISETLSPNQLL